MHRLYQEDEYIKFEEFVLSIYDSMNNPPPLFMSHLSANEKSHREYLWEIPDCARDDNVVLCDIDLNCFVEDMEYFYGDGYATDIWRFTTIPEILESKWDKWESIFNVTPAKLKAEIDQQDLCCSECDCWIDDCVCDVDDDDDYRTFYKSLYIGSVFSWMPTGKYWTWWACGNVDPIEQEYDRQFHDAMEEHLENHDLWQFNGEGCSTDLFLGMSAEREIDEEAA